METVLKRFMKSHKSDFKLLNLLCPRWILFDCSLEMETNCIIAAQRNNGGELSVPSLAAALSLCVVK